MKGIIWKKLNLFEKIIFCFGWVGVVSLLFWIILLIHNSVTQEKKFWNPKSYRVVYIFGWINFAAFILSVVLTVIALIKAFSV